MLLMAKMKFKSARCQKQGIQLARITFIDHDSLVVRASASGAVGRGFAPRPGHTKDGKNGTYKKAGGYLLLVMSQ